MRRNKYGVRPKHERTVDGIVFDSKKEASRYRDLKLLEKAKVICDLQLQPPYECAVNGKKICTYKADFRYIRDGELVVEDVKGVRTPLYRIKKKLVEALYGIEITEV